MATMAKRPRCANMLQDLDEEKASEVLEHILSSLQSMQGKAARISKMLQPAVTDDSSTSSWWSYAEKPLNDWFRKQCAELSLDLYKDIEALAHSISPTRNATQVSSIK